MEGYTYEWTEQDQREYEAAELASYKQQIAAQDKFTKVLSKLSRKLRQHIEWRYEYSTITRCRIVRRRDIEDIKKKEKLTKKICKDSKFRYMYSNYSYDTFFDCGGGVDLIPIGKDRFLRIESYE